MTRKKVLLALYLKKQSIRQQVNMLKFYEDQTKQKLMALESKSDNIILESNSDNIILTKNNFLESESDNIILTKNNFLESESDNETSEEY